jgi:hypothetical protein
VSGSLIAGAGSAAFQLAFQLSPIIFTGGIAQSLPGQALPIVVITEGVDFIGGLLGGSTSLNLNNFFANFAPLPGGTLADNQIGKYPFANSKVAANAMIQSELFISMLMICPTQNNYLASLATITALTATMNSHDSIGGTYTVLTPKYIYHNLVRRRMTDVSGNNTHQAQNAYQIDFEQPLLTLEAAQAAQNRLTSILSGGTSLPSLPTLGGAGVSSVGISFP